MVLSCVLVLYGERGLGIYRDPAARKEVAMVSCPSSHPEAKARLCASPHSGGIGPLYMNIHDETRESGVLTSLPLASCGAIRRAVRVRLSGDVAKGRTQALNVAVAAYVLA
jgi:hypothetical protein